MSGAEQGPPREPGRPRRHDHHDRIGNDELQPLLAGLTAVRDGDFTIRLATDAPDLSGEIARVFNGMVEQLARFTDEVTRVAREVGSDGRLGGQAQVRGVGGAWRDLTDSVNAMADNLTGQVRNIALVTTAVANGDLTKKIDVDARGEILELKTTINTMVDQLSSFAAEVTRVAREVGSEGRLGGQAEVEGVSGTWKRLTENVNELAGNLTRQVRAIAEVASAVAEGDLTRTIAVDASGEVAQLKDNINTMVGSLRETTRANRDQNWLKSNLARISGLLQGRRDLAVVADVVMDELTPLVSAQYGAFYLAEEGPSGPRLRPIGAYGARVADLPTLAPGESLVGQAARSRRTITVDAVPAGYLVSSGLGHAPPAALVVLPILAEDQVVGVIELASLSLFTRVQHAFLDELMESVGVAINTILANTRTDELLDESQRLAVELQARSEQLQDQQDELRRSNDELADKAGLLAEQNRDIEAKNREIEQARQELEDRARQLTATSKYKSEFLANMSHELRTPLNSLLVLAQLLAQNAAGNLTAKQVEYAGIIHSAGSDLLQLIDDILDLSKVEAGKMEIHPEPVAVRGLLDDLEAAFRPMTAQKELDLAFTLARDAPAELVTDAARLRQVLRNLLSNAVKFTESGGVALSVDRPSPEEAPEEVGTPGEVVAFRVRDSGIGIPPDELDSIFGAFQQADGTTSRKYAGTGLGLSISREMAQLLGGTLAAHSTPGQGSVFTLYLPTTPPSGGGPAAGHSARAAEAAPAATESTPAMAAIGGPLAGRTVLVVDDDARNLYAISTALELHGARIVAASDGRAAVAELARHPETDLVLMDVMMPGMDGDTATAAIRRMPGYRDVPIVMVTAKAMPGDREKSLEAGADGYLTKPVDTDDLVAHVRRLLAGRAPRAES